LPHPLGKPANKPLPISIVLEKVCLSGLPVPHHPAGDVIDRSGIFNPEMSCHAMQHDTINRRLHSLFLRADPRTAQSTDACILYS